MDTLNSFFDDIKFHKPWRDQVTFDSSWHGHPLMQIDEYYEDDFWNGLENTFQDLFDYDKMKKKCKTIKDVITYYEKEING